MPSEPGPKSHHFDGVLLATAALGLFVSAQPAALHDQSLALFGLPGLPATIADSPLAALWLHGVQAIAATGLELHAAALVVAAIAVAAAAWMTHAAAQTLGLMRGEALAAAALVAGTPAAATAATTVHVHAVELGLGAAAIWLAARMARHGRWITAAMLGVLIGSSFVASPAGWLVALMIVPFWLLEWSDASEPAPAAGNHETCWRRMAPLVGCAVVATVLAVALPWHYPPALLPTWDQIVNYDIGTLGKLFGRDAGRSFLPLSVGILAALWSPRRHRCALVVLFLVAVGLLLGCHQTRTLGDDGSFLLPVLPMAALLVARTLSRRWAIVAVVLAVLLSATKTLLRADHGAASSFVAGYEKVVVDRACRVIAGPYRDQAFFLSHLGHVSQESVLKIASADATRTVEQVIEELSAAASTGTCLLLTEEAEQALREVEFRVRYPHSAALLKQLEATFEWRRQRAEGFVATELVPR